MSMNGRRKDKKKGEEEEEEGREKREDFSECSRQKDQQALFAAFVQLAMLKERLRWDFRVLLAVSKVSWCSAGSTRSSVGNKLNPI